jgi:curved DNA-binding protein CbpA
MTRSEALKELGLPPNRKYSEKDIKNAYRKRSLETHPDKGGSNEQFVRVAEAYEVLQGGSSGKPSFQFSGDSGFEEKMQHAEDMFFEMFEEYLETGQAVDMLIEKLFGSDSELSWTQRQFKAAITRIGRSLLQKAAKFLMESDSLTININGQAMTSSDLRQWKEKMKMRREQKKAGTARTESPEKDL